MKIIVLGTRGFPNIQGGVETHCQCLYPRLAKMGLDVTVCTRTHYLTRPFKSDWKGVKFINIRCPRSKSLEAVVHTTLAVFGAGLFHADADIAHIHSIGPSLLVPLAKLMGLKVVMTHHGPDYERAKWGWLAKAVLRLGERLGCTYADKIITISADIKAHVKRKFNRDAYLIPNGVEIREPTRKTDYIEDIGLTPNKYCLAVGRFVPEKGQDDLISAFSSLQTDWKLAIAGEADHKTSYSRRLKSQVANNSKIVITGSIQGDYLNEIYSHAGVFVLPSYYEGFPIVTLEALSYGLPVLLSNIAPNKEIGLDENRYFPVGDKEALAERLDYWMKKGHLSREEQIRQIKMVRQKYDWDDIAEQVLQVYKSVSTQLK